MSLTAPGTTSAQSFSSTILVGIFTIALGFGFSFSASAQTKEEVDPFAGIEEMVVVGSGTAAIFQSQEVSTIAFNSEYLEAIGAKDLGDVAQFTPNLEIRTPFAASNPTLFIRGVGLRDFNANSSSSVAVYNDEVYMNSPAAQLSQLFDVSDVAVLRGPQGTEYGRNASAGTIRVIARKPSGTPGARFDVTYGRFNEINIDGAVESVLIPDLISVRSAGRMNRRDGTTRNRCADTGFFDFPVVPVGGRTNPSFASNVYDACFNKNNRGTADVPGGNRGIWDKLTRAPVKRWVNDTDNWGARTIIRITPDYKDMEWLINFHGGKNRGDSRQFQVVGATQTATSIFPNAQQKRDVDGYVDPDLDTSLKPSPFSGDPFAGDYNNVNKEKIDLFGANVVGSVTLGDYKLTTITAYEWNKRRVVLNLDGNPFPSLEPELSNDARQVSEELRLDWDNDDGLSGQLAGMFLYESLEVANVFTLTPVAPAIRQHYTFFTRYAAVWAKGRWEPAEEFSMEGGIRFNYSDKEINIDSQSFDQLQGTITTPQSNFSSNNAAAKETGLAGDVRFTYHPTEDISFYLRYARGWKGPHINGGVVNANQRTSSGASLVTPVKPEKVDSVEFGLKSQLWEQRITWNWALFYYNYTDLQVFQLKNTSGGVPTQSLINAKDANILGVEMELGIKPFEGLFDFPILDGLWIHITFAWLDSKYTDFVNTQTVLSNDVPITTQVDFSGNRLINSPKFSFIGFVMWPIPTPWGAFIPRFDWSFKDKVYFSQANIDLLSQDPLWLLNARLTYKAPTGNFEVSGWVKNLTDQAYTVDTFNLARLRRAILYAIGNPRTYGVTVKVSF